MNNETFYIFHVVESTKTLGTAELQIDVNSFNEKNNQMGFVPTAFRMAQIPAKLTEAVEWYVR